MLLKCCTQYVSKFGKLVSGQRPGKGLFSFQSQRRAMPKNSPAPIQLHSFHILARLYSKSFKLGFSSMWTSKFRMYKLGLKKAEELEIKYPTFIGSQRKQGNSKKTSTSAPLTTLKPLTMWITANCGKFLKRWGVPHLTCLLRNLYVGQEATVGNRHGTTEQFKIGKGVMARLYIVTLLI